MATSSLEATFDTLLRQLGGPDMEAEYRFAPPRRWRFDRAHLPSRVAVELQGGVWNRGRHVRGAGYEGDCEKGFEAVLDGWVVFNLTAKMLRDDPARFVGGIIETIDRRSR